MDERVIILDECGPVEVDWDYIRNNENYFVYNGYSITNGVMTHSYSLRTSP
jgi:hypothetical protein